VNPSEYSCPTVHATSKSPATTRTYHDMRRGVPAATATRFGPGRPSGPFRSPPPRRLIPSPVDVEV
jgi:hypothetical protein